MSASRKYRVFVLGLLFVSSVGQAFAQTESTDPKTEKPGQTSGELKPGYQLQPGDDPAPPIQSIVPRSAAMQARIEALSWYMTGRLLDSSHRNEPQKALNAFRKAIHLDSEAIEIYRAIVPLEFQFENVSAAVRYASKAVQLDPDDYNILEILARHAAISRQIPEAIKYFEQAVNSPRVEKESPEFVLLNRDLGILYARTGQREKAGDCYEIIFDAVKSPQKYELDSRIKSSLLADSETSYERIGQVLLEANRLKPALEAFEMAAKSTRPGAGNLSFNRAKILYLSEKYEEALAELQKYFDEQRRSKGREPYQLLADILQKLNKSDELIGRLEKMADDDAQNVSLQYFFADRLADANELDRARKIYDTMLQQGGDSSGYGGLARVLRKMKKSEELLDALGRGMARGEDAIATLEPELKALSEDKALMKMLIDEGRLRADAKRLRFEEAYLLAKIAAELKEPVASGEFYKIAIAANRDEVQPQKLMQMKFQLRVEMAEMYERLRKHQEAAEVYKQILETKQLTEQAQIRFHALLAWELARANHIDEALAMIAEAIKLEDDNPRWRSLQAGIYTLARRWDEAIVKYEQFMQDFSEEKEEILRAQFTLSNVYVQKGEMQKGEAILEKILESNPDSSQANNDLGYLWADQGKNLDQAEKMIRKALAAEPDNGSYLDSLGWVLFKLGKLDEAVAPLEEATKRIAGTGGDSTVWDHLGDLFLKMMQTEKAVEAWKTAVQHLEEENSQDEQLLGRIKDKLKQHDSHERPKPAEKGAP